MNNIKLRDTVILNKNRNYKHFIFEIWWCLFKYFKTLNFSFIESKELVTTKECFDNLLIDIDHPSRSMSDTFYINENMILSTQSTVFWNKCLEFYPEINHFFTISKVYRKDFKGSRHYPMFHQCDILYLDIDFCNIQKFIVVFLQKIFNKKINYRFRASYFPYTRFSSEVDIQCFRCKDKNNMISSCSLCQNSGWIEIMGFGVPNYKILEKISHSKWNNSNLTGLAFGIGLERLCMIKYNINDIRDLYL